MHNGLVKENKPVLAASSLPLCPNKGVLLLPGVSAKQRAFPATVNLIRVHAGHRGP